MDFVFQQFSHLKPDFVNIEQRQISTDDLTGSRMSPERLCLYPQRFLLANQLIKTARKFGIENVDGRIVNVLFAFVMMYYRELMIYVIENKLEGSGIQVLRSLGIITNDMLTAIQDFNHKRFTASVSVGAADTGVPGSAGFCGGNVKLSSCDAEMPMQEDSRYNTLQQSGSHGSGGNLQRNCLTDGDILNIDILPKGLKEKLKENKRVFAMRFANRLVAQQFSKKNNDQDDRPNDNVQRDNNANKQLRNIPPIRIGLMELRDCFTERLFPHKTRLYAGRYLPTLRIPNDIAFRMVEKIEKIMAKRERQLALLETREGSEEDESDLSSSRTIMESTSAGNGQKIN